MLVEEVFDVPAVARSMSTRTRVGVDTFCGSTNKVDGDDDAAMGDDDTVSCNRARQIARIDDSGGSVVVVGCDSG